MNMDSMVISILVMVLVTRIWTVHSMEEEVLEVPITQLDAGLVIVDVFITLECIHPYFLCIVTQCLFWEVSIMRKSCQVIVGNPPISQGLKFPQLWGPWVIRLS